MPEDDDLITQSPAEKGKCRDCGSEDATFAPDPFASEIHDDETPVWLCENCRHERWLDT
jgi:hypothetical protein